MATGETKAGWGALAKGAAGAAVLGIAGFAGTVFTNILSAPKDTVAYDLVQSITGALKGGQSQSQSPQGPERTAATPAPASSASRPETEVAATASSAATTDASPAPGTGLPSAADVALPRTSAPPPAPADSLLDRAHRTAAVIEATRSKTAGLLGARVLTLDDRAETPICGKTYRVEVTSVAAGRAEVSLRSDGSSSLKLAVGAPQDVAEKCRVELLMAYEDLTTRRAQLRETKAP